MTILIAGDEPCPSVAAAQREYDRRQRDAVPKGDERVERRTEKNFYPAVKVCWYRPDAKVTCTFPTREELLESAFAQGEMFACDEEGTLYGEPVAVDMDCPASVMQTNGTLHATTFVGSDEYPARTECIYELSYDTTCGGKAVLGLN